MMAAARAGKAASVMTSRGWMVVPAPSRPPRMTRMTPAPIPMNPIVARTAATFHNGGQSGFTPQKSAVPATSHIAMSGAARASMRDSLP